MNNLKEFESIPLYHLSGLDIIVALKPNQRFRDDGIVPDVADHHRKIIEAFGSNPELFDKPDEEENALCHYLNFFGSPELFDKLDKGENSLCHNLNLDQTLEASVILEACVIYYKDYSGEDFKPWVQPYLQAHEETHMLYKFGLIDSLQNDLFGQGFNLNLDKVMHNEELIACIGGFLGVQKKEVTLDYSDIKDNPFMERAYTLLKESKGKSNEVDQSESSGFKEDDFKGFGIFNELDLKYVSLDNDDRYIIVTQEPTYIEQGSSYLEIVANAPTRIKQSGRLRVIANSPVMLEGGSTPADIDSYAPMLIRQASGDITGNLRASTVIVGGSGYLNIDVSSDLDVGILRRASPNNREYSSNNDHSFFNATQKIRGMVVIREGTHNPIIHKTNK